MNALGQTVRSWSRISPGQQLPLEASWTGIYLVEVKAPGWISRQVLVVD
jgi:hypothetical protein